MDALVLAARLVLAAVFAIAAAGKLADRDGTRAAAIELGVPPEATAAFALALPLAELTVAAALVLDATARAGATAALALLLAFSAAIARSLAHGRRPDCHCLGQLRGGRVGSGTLARNFVLAVLAGLVLVA
jgi:uncharacterized membrane protein YphA (DoxX/SURF4 family)